MTAPLSPPCDGNTAEEEALPVELTRQLLKLEDVPEAEQQVRLTAEALVATRELLKLFVTEARHRAGIEAECDHEGTVRPRESDEDKIPIRADHVTKIAAELVFDFST